jgi:nitroreductase
MSKKEIYMFHDLVKKARSFRRFDESSPISNDVLTELVDMARVVPNGGNQQPLRYRIVSDAEERAEVFQHLAWAGALKNWPGPDEGERPTGYIIILADASRDNAPATTLALPHRPSSWGRRISE